MVQMKVGILKEKGIKKIIFISHMVQMKAEGLRQHKRQRWPLYPTWFR